MEEIWKDIEGYEGLYEVSNRGKVKSLDRYVYREYSKNNLTHINERILKQGKSSNGYLTVNLLKDCVQKSYCVHRLVASAFIPNPNNLPEVNHRDENKTNNNVNNLEWCTSKYNLEYGTRKDRQIKAMAGRCNTKHSKKVQCVETMEVYPSIQEVGRRLGFNPNHISDCCLGKRKTANGFHWAYA